MIYVFDTSPLSSLFKNYYCSWFPSLWKYFDDLVEEERLTSTREVCRELEVGPVEAARLWVSDNKAIFTTPNAAEGALVAKIYAVPYFQQNVEKKKLYKGGFNADAFVAAKARSIGGTAMTLEKKVPNAAKLPNLCEHLKVPCLSLEEFMEKENWKF